jgi:hypothetical protein
VELVTLPLRYDFHSGVGEHAELAVLSLHRCRCEGFLGLAQALEQGLGNADD